MARLDVYPNGSEGYLLDVQTDILYGLNSRLVVPLMPPDAAPSPGKRLNPTFVIEGKPFVMVTQYMGAIASPGLPRPVANFGRHHVEIVAALDMIFLGF